MFKGRYLHRIDNKGRVNLPFKMRQEAGRGVIFNDFVVTKGMNGCLALFPVKTFDELEKNFDASELPDDARIYLAREFFSYSHEFSLDSQGRIKLPSLLIEDAQLNGDVLVLGVGHWIEFWNPDVYNEFIEKSKVKYENLAKVIFGSLLKKNKPNDSENNGPNNEENIPPAGDG
ncbi:cell division/cell wall cluster transcriptional repressor MraZ [bacterium]|nr:cell division/cell wall cluster transcriptional repressor MraZ [bacterium]